MKTTVKGMRQAPGPSAAGRDPLDERILNRLCRQAERRKWASTYLLTGNELERKKALAIAFAKAINCEKLSSSLRGGRKADEAISEIASPARPTFDGLGRAASLKASPRNDIRGCNCSACRRIEAGAYPDVKWYGVDEEVNSIKISEARDFKNWLNLKPFEGKTKVFIFNRAERLTAEAQNALLKSLEEPPPGNVILLLVPNRKALFDTITSRAIEIKVPPFQTQAICERLVREGIARDEAEFLARSSQGELARARVAFEGKWFQKKNEWIDALVKEPASLLEQFHGESRDEVKHLFDFLTEWFRDLVVFGATRDREHLVHIDRLKLIQSIASRHGWESILELFETLNQIRRSIDDYANQKLLLTEAEILLERFFK